MLIHPVKARQDTSSARPGPEHDGLLHEMLSGELFEASLHLTPGRIRDSVDAAKSVGGALKGAWKDLDQYLRTALSLPQLKDHISPQTRKRLTQVAIEVATGVGYAAAGIQGAAGIYKIVKGHQKKQLSTELGGALDVATSAVIATTIAGVPVAPLVLGPLAAALGVVRGGYNATSGYRKAESRHEIQGFLDSTRSLGIFFRLLGKYSAGLALTGAVLGPIAGAVQLSRGYYDLRAGLEQQSNAKQLQGLTDIATAVGLTLSLTGAGTIPGVALVVAATGTRVIYGLNHHFKAWTDHRLERMRPGLEKLTHRVDAVVMPALEKVRPVIGKCTGLRRGSAKPRIEPPRVPSTP